LGSVWHFGQRIYRSNLTQTWHVLCPLVDSKGSTNEVVDVSAIVQGPEDWVAEAMDLKTPSAAVIFIEIETPVSLNPKPNLTGKPCVYIDLCVYRVIVLGCYRSH